MSVFKICGTGKDCSIITTDSESNAKHHAQHLE